MVTRQAHQKALRGRAFVRVAMLLATVAVLLLCTAGPAAAADPSGRYDGRYPGEVPGCGGNIRVGPVRSIYSTLGTYHGWAEQRWSNRGSCWGYQWIRLHVTVGIPVARWHDGSIGYLWTTLSSSRSARFTYTKDSITYLAPGTYDRRMLYAPHDPLCGIIFVRPGLADGAYSDLIFGHGGVEYPFCT